MTVILALLSGASFGAGDFLGGMATREEGSAPAVVAWAHVVSLGALAMAVWWFPREVTRADLAWGALAGVAGAIGLMLLYRGLAVGQMSIVAPITAVGSAVVPMAYGLVVGEEVGAVAGSGAVIALVGVWALSSGRRTASGIGMRTAGLAEAVASGVGFGLFFILIANTTEESGLTPLLASRAVSITMFAIVVIAIRGHLRLKRATVRPMAAAGVLDITANALFLLAARAGSLPIAAVLSSLYPAATVVLARVVLDEPIDRRRGLAMGAVAMGVTLIALGRP